MADSTISGLIAQAEQGGLDSSKLFDALYSHLHRLAKRQLARQGFGVSLSATTLLHEAYIEMAAKEGPSFPDQARFMAYTARVMRGLIIDHARQRLAIKRGGQFEITSLVDDHDGNAVDGQELTRISQALDELANVDSSLSQIVDLKFFCGFTFVEIAQMQCLSERTVQRKWEKARIYLHRHLRTDLTA